MTLSLIEILLGFIGTILVALIASGGFWAFLERKSNKKNATTTLVLGIAHMKIVEVGLRFIKRGYVTKAEYQDYFNYLVKPYNEHGGNGLAEQIVKQVQELPISATTEPIERPYQEDSHN